MPRPLGQTTAPQRTLPPAAAPTTSAGYVLQEIDKLAAEGKLPPGAPDRIRAKVAAAQAETAKHGSWGGVRKALGFGAKQTQGEFRLLSSQQRKMPMPGKITQEIPPPQPVCPGMGPIQGPNQPVTVGGGMETPLPDAMRARLSESQSDSLHATLEATNSRALRSAEAANREIDRAAHFSSDPKAFQAHIIKITPDRDLRLRHMGLAAGIGVTALGADAVHNKVQTHRNFGAMMDVAPELKKMDQARVQRAYKTLSKWAPQMTEDPDTAASTVKKIVEYESVDPSTVRTLQQNQQDPSSFTRRLTGVLARSVGIDQF